MRLCSVRRNLAIYCVQSRGDFKHYSTSGSKKAAKCSVLVGHGALSLFRVRRHKPICARASGHKHIGTVALEKQLGAAKATTTRAIMKRVDTHAHHHRRPVGTVCCADVLVPLKCLPASAVACRMHISRASRVSSTNAIFSVVFLWPHELAQGSGS